MFTFSSVQKKTFGLAQLDFALENLDLCELICRSVFRFSH